MTEQVLSKEKHAEFFVTQKAVLYDESRKEFLLFRIAMSDGYFAQHFGPWDFVGGRVEREETFLNGLSREVIEEAGDIQFDIDETVGVEEVSYSDDRKAIAVGYLTLFRGGDITLHAEHDRYNG